MVPGGRYITAFALGGQQVITEDMLNNLTPEDHEWALKQWKTMAGGAQFQPPMVDKLTVDMPGFAGGAEWGGPAVDPASGIFYINENDTPWLIGLTQPPPPGSAGEQTYQGQCSGCHGINRGGAPPLIPSLAGIEGRLTEDEISATIHSGKSRMPSFASLGDERITQVVHYLTRAPQQTERTQAGDKLPGDDMMPYKSLGFRRFTDPQGYPAVTPPWGTLNAIDLNTGKSLAHSVRYLPQN